MRDGTRLCWRQWVTAGLFLFGLMQAHATACQGHFPVPWRSLGHGAWIWLPPGWGDVSPRNKGHVVPTSVIIAGRKALVIDPGPSHAHGLRLRRSLACRFGVRVAWIINTHAHAENVLANSAFADDVAAGQVQVMSSGPTREAMALRCPDCLGSLIRRAGADALRGTRIVLPTRTLVSGDELNIGAWRLQVMPVERGHTEGDLVLWSARYRVLWAGGLAYQGRVPELAQGRLDNWLMALQRLSALRPLHVVSTTWSQARPDGAVPALLATQAYLSALRTVTWQAMDEGAQPQDLHRAELPAFRDWAGYRERHGFNAQRAWRELEPEWMAQPPVPASIEDVGR